MLMTVPSCGVTFSTSESPAHLANRHTALSAHESHANTEREKYSEDHLALRGAGQQAV